MNQPGLPLLVLLSVSLAVSGGRAAAGEDPVNAPSKPRLLVLTDIGGDPDDQQSMVRLMVYANEFEIEGLIATAAGTPGQLKEQVTKPQLIRETASPAGRWFIYQRQPDG